MPSINNQPVLPGVFTQVQQQLLPSVTGGIRVAALIGTGRLTNLVTGESVTRGSGNNDALAHTAMVLDGTTITDQNFAVYRSGVDYSSTPVSGGIGWLSSAATLTGTKPDATAEDTTTSVFFTVLQVVDGMHLVVSSTSGLVATNTITQGSLSTTITSVTDSTHLVVGSTTGWVATPFASTLVGDTFQIAVGNTIEPTYTFKAQDFTYYGVDTTTSTDFEVIQVVDGTHLVVNSTAGLVATNSINQNGIAGTTTTITTVTDTTHLVVGSTANWVPTVLTTANVASALTTAFTGDGLTFTVTTSGGNNYLTITTTATSNTSFTIENGTSNSVLGFTAGSLVSTPQRPALGVVYFVNYEWAKAVGDGQGSFSPKFYFLQNFSTVTNDVGTVGGGDSQTANMNGAWTLPIAAQLAQENGASIICLLQMNPADGSNASQVRAALAKLYIPNINIVVSLDAADNAMLIPDITNHVTTASSTINRLERTAFIGFSDESNPSDSTMLGYATSASSNRVVVVNQTNTTYTMFIGTNTTVSTVDGTMMATALAALRTNPAFDVAQPLTREVVSGIATTNTLTQAEKTIFANNGVLVVDNISGSPKVVFGTTSEFDTILNQLYQVTEIADYCTQTLRGLLDPIFIGQKLLANTPSQVETVTSAILSDIESSNIIESFTQPTATVNPLQPTQILVNVGVQPVLELDTIFITLGLNLV
jgi:hypothetical protein